MTVKTSDWTDSGGGYVMKSANALRWFGVGFEYWAKRWYLAADLRHWMFGVEWYASEVDVAVGPFRLEVYR